MAERVRRTRTDSTYVVPKMSSGVVGSTATPTSSTSKSGPSAPPPSRGTGVISKKGGSHPELRSRVTDRCRCQQTQLTLKFPIGRNKNVDYQAAFANCSTCQRGAPEYLCLKCTKVFCEEHMRKHFAAESEHTMTLFNELVRYEEAFYCFKCNSFTIIEPFDDFLDSMFVSKGSFVDVPVTHKYAEYFENNGKVAVTATMQGWRSANEDAHTVYLSMPKFPKYDYIGVFDGHGGPLVARYTGTRLMQIFEDILQEGETDLTKALTKSFIACDEAILADGTLAQSESGSCGTTSNVVLVDNVNKVLYCANAGDARAVLCRGGKAIPLSVDHSPSCPGERERILASGSSISEDNRVDGLLAVSRAIGDFDFKQAGSLPPERQAVTCVPEVSKTQWQADDEFVIVACDGVWDVLQCQQAVDFLHPRLKNQGDGLKAVEALLDRCVAKVITEDGIGTDNMSVIVLLLKKF